MKPEQKKILVVDDDLLFLDRVQAFLMEEGYAVLRARDGDEALEAARREKPDLMIIDLLLPQKNGFELAVELKREPELAKTPLVFITAYFASHEIKAKFKRLPQGGALLNKLMVLHKPLEKRELLESLRGVLDDGVWSETPKRILVVDDDPVNLELIGRRLEVDRMISVPVQTGDEALRLLQCESFDAVLLDLRLPDQDGFRILAEIRKTHACLPVVIMTAHGSEAVAAKAVGAGASDYLIKPIGRRELAISLRNALYKSQLQLETQRVQKNLFDAMLALQQITQEMSREQRRLGGVLQSLNEGVVVLDTADRVERFNPAVLHLLQQEAAPLALDTLFSGVSEVRDEAERMLDKSAFLQALKAGVQEAEFLLRWADGQEKAFLLSSKPFTQADQSGYVLVLRDVTRRRTQRQHLEILLRSQSDTLSDANQRLRQDLSAVWQEADGVGMTLLSSVAGELKKSLNIVVSLACHLISGVEGNLAPRQHELVEQMLSGAEGLSERMGDLLDYALLRTAGQAVQKRTVHLDEVLRVAAEESQPRARGRDVTLLFEDRHYHAEAWGHPDFLLKIIRQLLANAIECTPAGGCVTVSLITGQDSESGIEIRDQGQGISPELAAQLVGADRESELRGFRQDGAAGLGLYLVKGYADLLGARLELQSEDGRGSVFRVFLPKIN